MVKPNFSDDFMAEVLGQATSKKGARASVSIENLKDLFRTTIYTNNPDVRQRILDTFTDIIPETLPGKTGLLELRERLTTDPILKKYMRPIVWKQHRYPLARDFDTVFRGNGFDEAGFIEADTNGL